jgi:DNA-binding NarL/FixJ family response regulator
MKKLDQSINSRPIEILIVDDHPHVRRLLREVIGTHDNLKIVGEADNGEEAVLLAAKLKPDVIFMDIHLPVLSGVQATTLIKINNPFTAVIGLTAGDPHEDEKAMAIAGAASCMSCIPPLSAHSSKSSPRLALLAHPFSQPSFTAKLGDLLCSSLAADSLCGVMWQIIR